MLTKLQVLFLMEQLNADSDFLMKIRFLDTPVYKSFLMKTACKSYHIDMKDKFPFWRSHSVLISLGAHFGILS